VNLSRWLFGAEASSVAAAIVRDPTSGVDILTTGHMVFPGGLASFTCATQVEPDQRVHVYGTEGRISIEIPFNIPPLLPSRVFVTQGGDPPVAPATETIVLEPSDPYACEVDAFAAVVLDGEAPAVPLADAVENLRTIERLFATAGQGIGSP
jgi:predicted dehydrogenase